jgi:PAS domain S-box-containing protein
MSKSRDRREGLQDELEHLKSRLAEAEDTLRAIRSGEVDALVVETEEGEQVFTLAGADHPYRLMIEMMNEGAAILALNGTIFYCNQHFSEMVKTQLEKIIGGSIYQFIQPKEKTLFKTLIKHGVNSGGRDEIALRAAGGTSVPILLSVSNFQGINAASAICLVATDISEQKQSEESLKRSEQELRIKTRSLEEVNAALKVLLKRMEEGRRELEEKILANIRELVLPYIDKLKKTPLSEKQITCLTIAETNLDHIASSFLYNLKTKYLNLTHRETQVATLVKEGKSIKDIAEMLNVTPKTVEFHRNSLRRKLGLKNKRANLRSHLVTFL